MQNKSPSIPPVSLQALAQHLMQSLKEDKKDLQAMDTLLDSEKIALEHNEPDKLNEFSTQRNTLTEKFDKRHTHRLTLLHQAGLQAVDGSWKPVITTLANQTNPQILILWQSVEQQLAVCAEKLSVNEKIIANMRQNINQLMNALRGEMGSGETYNSDGKAKTFAAGKPFASA